MLDINKNITLNGISKINGVQVATINATIATDGNKQASVNSYISNKELYDANKSEVRNDISEFNRAVYELEDELIKESKLKKAGK